MSDTPDRASDLGRATLAATRRYTLTSRVIDQTFIIDVARPAFRVPASQQLPVVYVLDGDGAFGVAAQAARMMQMEVGGLPPMIIVGIGYQYSSPQLAMAEHGAWRTRDFSPSLDAASQGRTRAALREAGFSAEVSYGGATAFLDFIDNELKPFIADRLAVDSGDQTLVGMSLGGLFALHTLFVSMASFSRYVILSPALWWDKDMIFTKEVAYAERSDDLPARIFLGVGGREDEDGAPYWPVTKLAKMAATMRARHYASLHITHHVFPNETHMSVYPGAFVRGLREVFAET
jgi:predicted alpha/beta superfamily hydrolase